MVKSPKGHVTNCDRTTVEWTSKNKAVKRLVSPRPTSRKRVRRMPTGAAMISKDEADRAIYVDYECSQDKSPTLLGVLIEEELIQGIVEPAFDAFAGRWGVRQVIGKEHAAFVRELVERSLRENRLIISWSQFDYKHMVIGAPELGSKLCDRFRNAIPTAKRWRREKRPGVSGDNTLLLYLSLTRFAVPEEFRGQVVGTALGLIRRQLAQGRDHKDLTAAAKKGWRRVVRHNQYDLHGMRHVMLVASAGGQQETQ